MNSHPLPVIIFSILDPKTMDTSVKALILGAFDYIIKPGGVWKIEFPKFKDELVSKVLLAYKSRRTVKLKNKKKNIDLNIAKIEKQRKKQPRIKNQQYIKKERPFLSQYSNFKPINTFGAIKYALLVISSIIVSCQ